MVHMSMERYIPIQYIILLEAMYENKLMKTASGHDYLYDSIISVVEPSYKKINFEWSGSIVK